MQDYKVKWIPAFLSSLPGQVTGVESNTKCVVCEENEFGVESLLRVICV